MSIDNDIDFKDHIVQYPNRFKQTTIAPGIVELVPTWIETPEQIIQPGTPVDSELFKKLKENVTCYSQTYIATEGQTVFSVTHPYNVGQSRIAVYIGGVKQRTILDFTEASSTSFILKDPLIAGTTVEAITISFVQPPSTDIQQQIDNLLAVYLENQVQLNASRTELINLTRIPKNYIPADRLRTAENASRIKLENLADEVLQAMIGTTPINVTPGTSSVTTEKIANQGVTIPKLSSNIASSLSVIDSLTGEKRMFSTLASGYKRSTVDVGLASITGVYQDYPGNPSTYDVVTDTITVNKTSTVVTYIELVISNADLVKLRAASGFTFGFDVTPMTGLNGVPTEAAPLNFWVYAVKGSTATKIFEKNVTTPIVGVVYSIDEFVSNTLIPSDAECLRVYVRQGGEFVNSTVKIKNTFLQYGNTLGLGNLDKVNYQQKISDVLGISIIKTDVDSIEKSLLQTTLTADGLSSSLMTYKLENGILSSLTKNAGVTNSHPFVLFPESFSELAFTHIRNGDWIYLGGDLTKGTAICFGTPFNIRLIDLGPTNGTVADIAIADIPAINDRIHLKWSGDTLIARKNNGSGWADWFSVNLASYPQLVHYKMKKRFGAMTDTNNQAMMKNVSSSIDGLSVVDRVVNLENGSSKQWQGKTWNAVGDSITQAGLYIPLVSDSLGLVVSNQGLSSSTLAINNRYLQNKSVVERVIGSNGNTVMPNADLWTIFAGVNDWLYETPVGTIASTDQTTFYGALKTIVENVLQRSNYPKLILFTPLQSNRNGANNVGVTMQAYRQAIKDVGDYYSIPVLDLYGIGGFNPINLSRLAPDGVHPNATGTSVYYPKIVNIIKAI